MQSHALFTDARAAFEAGYKLEDAFTDKEITEENVDLYVVILEGNTRFWAFKSEMSPYPYSTSGPFEYTFMYKEIESGEQFMKLYRQINMTNYPLTVKDYGKDLAATEGGNKVLIEYTKLTSDLGMNSRAASFFLASSEITKHDVVKAYKGKMPDVFKDETILKQFESISGAYKHRFVKNEKMFPIAKGVGIPSWLASKVNEAADKEIVVSRLCEMLNKMSADEKDKSTSAKKTDSKKLEEG